MFNVDKCEKLLTEQGFKKNHICEACGRSRGWLRDLKLNKSSIKSHEIELIANMLNTTVDYLTDKTDIKEKPTDNGGLIAEIEQNYLLLNDENRKRVDERIAEYISLLLNSQN